MRTAKSVVSALVVLAIGSVSRGDVPKSIASAPCSTPPQIDGIIGTEEWSAATTIRFDLAMVQLGKGALESRPCELRLMNSRNALYVAFRVPDDTVNESVAPLVLDVAILAFAQSDHVQPGDDRKAIAAGIYRDKHIKATGKGDDDDRQQDGRGASSREKGTCTFEWAIPLDSGDKEDIKVKPGDSLRFNLAYFDAFQLPITKTKAGGVFGPQLDQADAWGTLKLAANVKDDGGSAFQAQQWAKPLLESIKTGPATRLRVSEAPDAKATDTWAKALVSFPYRDEHGSLKEAKGKIYLPGAVHSKPGEKFPLVFCAGYEVPDVAVAEYLRRGWVVASPRELAANPLVRTMNPDVAFLHCVRALPFIDDRRVMIGGGSAGGWMTLMLTAETFPLAGSAPDVPPVNWGYNAAYFFKQMDKAGPSGGSAPRVPVLFAVANLLAQSRSVYGGDFGDETWYAASPIAHVSTITCPVSVYWSTADVLVPIDQVGARWVQPLPKAKFPAGFTMNPASLLETRLGRQRFIDALDPKDFEVFVLDVPKGTGRHDSSTAPVARELPISRDRRWSIAIIDEGEPEPGLGHRKYLLTPMRFEFFDRVMTGEVATQQLSRAKLERLMDRYRGKEWLPSPLQNLDVPESERADVERGLRTYTAASAQNAANFQALYAKLPAERRVLTPAFVSELAQSKPTR